MHQAPGAGAEREPHRVLAPPADAADHEQVRDVRATEQQQGSTDGQQHRHLTLEALALHDGRAEPLEEPRANAFELVVVLWMAHRQPTHEHVELGLRRRERHLRRQPHDERIEQTIGSRRPSGRVAEVIDVRIGGARIPHVHTAERLRARERWRQHSDNRQRAPVRHHATTHRAGRAAKRAACQPVADHRDLGTRRKRIIFRTKRTARRNPNAQHVEEVGRDPTCAGDRR